MSPENLKSKSRLHRRQTTLKYICQLQPSPSKLLEQGIDVVSCDEMTGILALERLFLAKPGKPKQVEKIEFEYERHRTLSLIANSDVARGKVLIPHIRQVT